VRLPAGLLNEVGDQARDVAIVFGYQDLHESWGRTSFSLVQPRNPRAGTA
jgi:hypothetical protein